jgi:hypothetical protein
MGEILCTVVYLIPISILVFLGWHYIGDYCNKRLYVGSEIMLYLNFEHPVVISDPGF